MMVAGRAEVDGLVKGNSLLTVNHVGLYCLILAPAVTVYYHVEGTVYIEGEGQIPEGFPMYLPTFSRAATAAYTFSLLKLKYFAHGVL